MYVENGSKNRSGCLQDFKVANKRVCSYALGGERCHVYLLDLYISKLPVEAFLEDVFYMRPLAAIPPTYRHAMVCEKSTGAELVF